MLPHPAHFGHILRLWSQLFGAVESKSLISFQDNGNFLVALTSSKKTERKKLLLSTMLKDHVGQGGTKAIERYYETRMLYALAFPK